MVAEEAEIGGAAREEAPVVVVTSGVGVVSCQHRRSSAVSVVAEVEVEDPIGRGAKRLLLLVMIVGVAVDEVVEPGGNPAVISLRTMATTHP